MSCLIGTEVRAFLPAAIRIRRTLQADETGVLPCSFLGGRYGAMADPSSGEDTITFDGTIRWCEDLNQDPEDVVFLAVAYELKSPSMGTWTRQGWLDGWKSLG